MHDDETLRRFAIYQNIAKFYTPGVECSGLRSGALRHQSDAPSSAETLALDYWQASKYNKADLDKWSSISDYYDPVTTYLQRIAHDTIPAAQISLPAPLKLRAKLSDAIQKRRSIRSFTGEPIPLTYLSTILANSAGTTIRRQLEGGGTLGFRAAPSGGGLYPVNIAIASINIEGLRCGVFSYVAPAHGLDLDGSEVVARSLLGALIVPPEHSTRGIAALLMLTITPWRTMRKYGPRGLRFALQEVGSISQNVHLAATALGLGTTDWASFEEDIADKAMGNDGVYTGIAHVILIGQPAQ